MRNGDERSSGGRHDGWRRLAVAGVAGVVLLGGVACGSTGGSSEGTSGGSSGSGATTTVRLLTHDSFDLTPEVLQSFTDRTGIEVELIAGGDAVAMVNQAILTAGNPVADVLFGIDDNQLAGADAADLFDPTALPVPTGLRSDLPDPGIDGVVPVDVGDVCVNYDRAYFDEAGLAPPQTLEDLADDAYAGMLVVQNPATSSPGLSFLLATVDAFGPDGFAAYWERLVANDVLVADGWEEAYYGEFSGGSGEGGRPLVVSYATSPPAEVFYAESYATDAANGTLPEVAPTGVATDTCYRQVEYAGVLRGARGGDAARQLVEFLLSPEVQADIPLTMFVVPAVADTPLPDVFTRYAEVPTTVYSVPPAEVDAGRSTWVSTWRGVVLG